MCHHYRVELCPEEYAAVFEVVRTELEPQRELTRELYPLGMGPVIRLTDQGERELAELQWGLLPAWWKPSDRCKSRQAFQRQCFNARCETAHEKPSYRAAFRYRRCLVPVTAFEEKGHWFRLPETSCFLLAGLWEDWEQAGEIVQSYTILTTDPHPAIREVGHHRGPVILSDPEAQRRWLSPDVIEPQDLADLLTPWSGPLQVSAVNAAE